MPGLKRKDILGLQEMTVEEIDLILDTAEALKDLATRPVKKVPTLRGKAIVTLFYENSTRTAKSFELAAKYLGADVIHVSAATSSVQKGETLKDTARNLEAMGVDAVVVRHSMGGAPHLLARSLRASVINAGDGIHEHPTQGLLDMLTIRQKKGGFKGLKVAIVGDSYHSRVARSNIYGLAKYGAEVWLVGPSTLLAQGFEEYGVRTTTRVEEALEGADVVNVLRLQLERQEKGLFPTVAEYHRFWGVTAERLRLAKPDVLLMHPGPMNRGVEIATAVADGPQSVITEQVTNGVAVRMALLYLLLGGGEAA
ncbi:MAG: aspartate carbamoyltransferase catalytic subunit [Symbiobacterium sp.]|uniref:aspartate carbamoyltransferase catalytic subunit n=1 Tax=Symbiobacterium sp. TaxID=1971213 RepID=UPI0034648999